MLRDLVPIVQFKKREKHPWRSVILVKLQAKSKWYQIAQNITNKHWEEITHRDNLTHNTNWLVFGKGEQAHIYG